MVCGKMIANSVTERGHALRIAVGFMMLGLLMAGGVGASALSGGTLAFISDRSGTDNIWSINSDGFGLTQLTSDGIGYNIQPDWSPDGTKIIWNVNDYI
jgi:hypothetical protein